MERELVRGRAIVRRMVAVDIDVDLLDLYRLALEQVDLSVDHGPANREVVSDLRVVVAVRFVEQIEALEILAEYAEIEFRTRLPRRIDGAFPGAQDRLEVGIVENPVAGKADAPDLPFAGRIQVVDGERARVPGGEQHQRRAKPASNSCGAGAFAVRHDASCGRGGRTQSPNYLARRSLGLAPRISRCARRCLNDHSAEPQRQTEFA